MSPVAAGGIFCFWLLLAGVTTVYFEVETVHCGVRVQKLLDQGDQLLDELRREEMCYNELISPDLLEKHLRDNEELWTEYESFQYPIPSDEDLKGGLARSSLER